MSELSIQKQFDLLEKILPPDSSTWREQVLSAGGQRAEAKSKAADRSPTQNIDITILQADQKSKG